VWLLGREWEGRLGRELGKEMLGIKVLELVMAWVRECQGWG